MQLAARPMLRAIAQNAICVPFIAIGTAANYPSAPHTTLKFMLLGRKRDLLQ
jgi:hypothetical protein